MAASGLRMYNLAKEYLMDGTIDLDTQEFNVHLARSGANVSTYTLTALSEITGELASANGYTLSGNVLTAHTWAQGASAKERRFDGSVAKWSANGGNLGSVSASMNIAYAFVVAATGTSAKDGANKLLGWYNLTTSPFQVTDTNSLTLTINANGLFELNGAVT